MLFTIGELIDIVLMTAVIGFIFKDMFRKKPSYEEYDPLKPKKTISNEFWSAALTVAPAIVLHELGHKFVALALGLQATFHAAYDFLALGLILKFMNFGFIFFVPAYVSHTATTGLNSAMIAFAGPGTNLLLWIICWAVIKHNLVQNKYLRLVYFAKYINGFLFVVNMLPIPGLDGYHVISGLLSAFGF